MLLENESILNGRRVTIGGEARLDIRKLINLRWLRKNLIDGPITYMSVEDLSLIYPHSPLCATTIKSIDGVR